MHQDHLMKLPIGVSWLRLILYQLIDIFLGADDINQGVVLWQLKTV